MTPRGRWAAGLAAALAMFGVLALAVSAAQDTAARAPAGADPCAAIAALYAPQGGQAALRPLPVVEPAAADRTLTLDLKAERPRQGALMDGVMIGDLKVRGVPVFVVEPRAGTRVTIEDPRTGAPVAVPGTCLSSPFLAYGGMRWSVRQGDRLHLRVSSALDFQKGELRPPIAGGLSCRATNLHLHGLEVSPYRTVGADGGAVYGDYVFDAANAPGAPAEGDPCGAEAGRGARPATMDMGGGMSPAHGLVPGVMTLDDRIPGRPGESLYTPGGHPSGLFWYHPHVHGYTALETAGGMAGMVSVGALQDYACAQGPGAACAPSAVRVRDLLLKDAQVAPDHGGWRMEYDRDYDLEDACAPGRADGRLGECHDWRGHRWLFTVNGQRYPAIADVAAQRTEVWRIVNASANVTYRLRLRPEAGGEDLAFQVLSLEGAGAAPAGWAAPGEARELLLLPAARAEIALAAPAAGGTYVLEQEGFETGGDVWPAVALAEARFPAGRTTRPPALMLHGPPAAPPGQDRFYDDPACGFATDAVRRIYFVKRPTYADERRRLDTFGLIAAVSRQGGPPMMTDASGHTVELTPRTWQALLASDPHAPAFGHSPYGAVCTFLGHSETWVLENDTDEVHNFHIHQSAFQLALERRSDPAFFSAAPERTIDPLLNASDAAVQAADGDGRAAQEAALYHDTIPVPRGESLGGRGCDGSPMNRNCRPGRVTIRIHFDREEQIGDFVYHCHILQHEDDGMMATVRVLCPPGDSACVLRHGAAPPQP